jgi:hypothetical protein
VIKAGRLIGPIRRLRANSYTAAFCFSLEIDKINYLTCLRQLSFYVKILIVVNTSKRRRGIQLNPTKSYQLLAGRSSLFLTGTRSRLSRGGRRTRFRVSLGPVGGSHLPSWDRSRPSKLSEGVVGAWAGCCWGSRGSSLSGFLFGRGNRGSEAVGGSGGRGAGGSLLWGLASSSGDRSRSNSSAGSGSSSATTKTVAEQNLQALELSSQVL